MYVEERMYRLKIGTAPEYFRHYRASGMKVQLKHLPHLVGYYVTEVGGLNTVVHMWAYDGLTSARSAAPRCRPIRTGRPTSPRSAR